MKEQIYITIKDEDGNLYPKAYLEKKELHKLQRKPAMNEGDEFVEVKIIELKKSQHEIHI